MSRRKTDGFTLIELLVVIAIIAILAAILFPVFAQAREKARSTSCLSNNKQIMLGVKMYDQDYDEQCPWDWAVSIPGGYYATLMDLVNPYVKNPQVWICPSAAKSVTAYGSPCGSDSVSKIVSSYIWMDFDPYTYYQWFAGPNGFTGAIMFCGFPNPGNSYCVASGTRACIGVEQTDFPAQSAFFNEGYYITYNTSNTALPFGSACTEGTSGDWSNSLYYRHENGSNLAFCDGHAKWVLGQNLETNTSEKTTEIYVGYPESPFMKYR
jgi:prepilin-type N-terminal cleavage/methylation domain-containing protein/prepilin-type processing-associated H-X9-DG protein